MASELGLIGTIGDEDDVPLASESSDSDLDVSSNIILQVHVCSVVKRTLSVIVIHLYTEYLFYRPVTGDRLFCTVRYNLTKYGKVYFTPKITLLTLYIILYIYIDRQKQGVGVYLELKLHYQIYKYHVISKENTKITLFRASTN